MNAIYENAVLLSAVTGKEVAQVALNGTRVAAGATLAGSGRMRTFKLQSGSLRDHWLACQPLELRQANETATVRIAALPAAIGEVGFVEFVE